MFSASVKGAEARALAYSVDAATCANSLMVVTYLTDLFRSSPGSLVFPW